MSVIPTRDCIKMQLESSVSLWGRMIESDEVIMQKLTILSNGQIWLSNYMEGEFRAPRPPVRKEHFKISAEDAEEILARVDLSFSEIKNERVYDAGTWEMKLTNDAGEVKEVFGVLHVDGTINSSLSDLIRSKTNRKDLLLFDGNVED